MLSSTLSTALRWILFPLLVSCFWIPVSSGAGAAAQTHVYLFWGQGCPHCERAIDFLKRLEIGDARLRVRYFEVTREEGNVDLFRAVVKAFEIEQPRVPLAVIGDQVGVGYSVDEQTGAEIRDRLEVCYKAACPDSVAGLITQLSMAVVEARPPQHGASP